MTDFIEHVRTQVLEAAVSRTPVRIRGGGTKDFYGCEPCGEVLDTRTHSGIVAYDPSELVITVKAGTSLTEVESTLVASGQCLPFEPPHFGEGATIGGCVAAGLSGPRRMQAGSVRDYLLGTTLMDGRGEVLRFGGQVMKNVAGFDTFRLQAGAMGTLGLLLELSFKVLPHPEAEVTRVFESDAASAITTMNRLAGQPLPITASCQLDGRLYLRLGGNAAAVATASSKLGGEEIADGASFWRSLREHELPFFKREKKPLWRLAVKSTSSSLASLGDELIDWGGAQRWLLSDKPADVIRAEAVKAGGHATLFRSHGPRSGDQKEVFQRPAPALLALQKRLKQTFDPAGIFDPGRLFPDF